MEKLSNHTLVYDSECPMCDLYTKGFIKAGMLDNNGRVQYGCALVPAGFSNDRARDEIALVDYSTGTVTYGLDSLIKIIGHSFPALGSTLRQRPIHWMLSKLYSFISYNRKVIAPPEVFEGQRSCTPSFHAGYRVAYVVFAWLVTSLMLANYTTTMQPIVPPGSFSREFIICAGQIIFQMVIVRLMTRDKLLHYIGNMMTVSLIGALLLLPMLVLTHVVNIPPAASLAWFTMVVTFMLCIHWQRVKMLGLPAWATVSWIAYRLLVLCIIL
ncbi:MAG TPA: hypothetical protein VF473_04115 [Cyclobacteriaceae bacterium]